MVNGDKPFIACMREGRFILTSLPVHARVVTIFRSWDVSGMSASSKYVLAMMYFCTIIWQYGSVVLLSEQSCNHAGRSVKAPVLDLPHIYRSVASSLFDMCLVLSTFCSGVVTAPLAAVDWFAVVIAAMSAARSGPCTGAPPSILTTVGTVSVGNTLVKTSFAHRCARTFGAANNSVPANIWIFIACIV